MLVHSYLTKKAKVVSSGIDRRGVFAKALIKKGEVACVFGGHIITQADYDRLEKKGFQRITEYAIKVADKFYLVSSLDGKLEDDDFINHSCNPNLGLKGHLLMVALRDIKKGEEITYDYAMTDADLDYSFKCRCKEPCCRKTITSNDWKIPALQRKYRGYFSWFIQEKISRRKR